MRDNGKLATGFIQVFDLSSEALDMAVRKPWPQGMTSKMLLKTGDFRIVLVAMEARARMRDHHADGRLSIQPLTGSLLLHVEGQSIELKPGSMLALDRSVSHDVEALLDCTFLLIIAWPPDDELESIEHRGYGS
jgi:quercetin dioxygenase-like cupin family protein